MDARPRFRNRRTRLTNSARERGACLIAETGTASAYVRCDNGPEFTAAALVNRRETAGVDTAFIDPGSPWQNGFIESFNAQFRREQLAGEIMDTMAEAKYLAEE